MQWSKEYSLFPPLAIRQLAGSLVVYGANLIIGSHPHVVQVVTLNFDTLAHMEPASVYSIAANCGNFFYSLKFVELKIGLLKQKIGLEF